MELIDLTADDSPHPNDGNRHAGALRPSNSRAAAAAAHRPAAGKRAHEPDVVELDQDEQQSQGMSDEEAARARIMAFAKRVRADVSPRPHPAERTDPPPAASGPREEHDTQRQRIMAHARRVNEEHGITHDAPLAAAPPPNNSLLAQLHAERLARQRRREAATKPSGNESMEPWHLPAQPEAGGGAAASLQQGAGPQQQQQGMGGGTSISGRSQHNSRAVTTISGQGGSMKRVQTAEQTAQQGGSVKLLSYNVWFMEECHVEARMAAIAAIVQEQRPDFVCLQVGSILINWACYCWGCSHASWP